MANNLYSVNEEFAFLWTSWLKFADNNFTSHVFHFWQVYLYLETIWCFETNPAFFPLFLFYITLIKFFLLQHVLYFTMWIFFPVTHFLVTLLLVTALLVLETPNWNLSFNRCLSLLTIKLFQRIIVFLFSYIYNTEGLYFIYTISYSTWLRRRTNVRNVSKFSFYSWFSHNPKRHKRQ